EGGGRVGEYVGGYQDWLRQRPAPAPPTAPPAPAPKPARNGKAAPEQRKLSYKDQRELEQLPARIEALEARLAEAGEAMSDPAFFKQDADAITAANEALAATQAELDAAYARWAELDG